MNTARNRGGFSLVEVLISLAITGTLLTAALAALDASFKSYKHVTEGASTHVVSRMVINRVMAMIRTGAEFGPFPLDVLDTATNPVRSTFVEFATKEDTAAGTKQIVRIERRDAAVAADGPYELWYIQKDYSAGVLTATNERPLVVGCTEVLFVLEYDVGPRLRRATVDLTIRPNDYQDAKFGGQLETPTIRLVSSVSPRRLVE